MKNDVIFLEFDENGCLLCWICSFVCCQGCLMKGQQYVLDNIWLVMGVEFNDVLFDFVVLFGCDVLVILEIGFGMGVLLVVMVKVKLEQNFFGIEVYFLGVGVCLVFVEEEGV